MANPKAFGHAPSSSLASLANIDVEAFDWRVFEGTYKGRALLTRLFHIPALLLTAPSSSYTPTSTHLLLARAALLRLIPRVKSETWDHQLYLRCVALVDASLHPEKLSQAKAAKVEREGDADDMEVEGEGGDGPSAISTSTGEGGEESGVPDLEWVEMARESERKEGAKLDVELRGYVSNLIKESIRLTYFAFAQLALKGGNMGSALKNYGSAREYSTSAQHHVDLGLGILEASLAFLSPTQLPGHLSKLETQLDRLHPPPATTSAAAAGSNAATGARASMTATDVREDRERAAKSVEVRRSVGVKLRVGRGMVALSQGEWEKAGREFGEIGEEGGLGEWEGVCVSTSDLSLLTALLTLATSPRSRVRRVLLDRASFRAGVDDSQGWLLDLVRAFMDAQYGEVSRILKKAEPHLLLNALVQPHLATLTHLIQKRCITQYVAPFSSVRITQMAEAFGVREEEMLSVVEGLVSAKDIHGKVDLIDKVLQRRKKDPKREAYEQAIKIGRETSETTRAALFRMRVHEAGICVDPRPPASKLEVGPGPGGKRDGGGALDFEEGVVGTDGGFGGDAVIDASARV